MLGGRLYDPATMVVTGTRTRAPYWWEANGSGYGASPRTAEGPADGD